MDIKAAVKRGTTDMGEFTEQQLEEKLKSGMISCYDKIYFAKKDEWIDIYKIRDIAEHITEDFHWRYRIQGEIRGPLAKTDLIFFIKEGKITSNDWVYHPQLKDWKKVEDMEEFKQFAPNPETKKESESAFEEAMESGFYKNCPNCGMQNLRSARSCKGCKYIFKAND